MKKTLLILAVLSIAASAYAVDASEGTQKGDKALLFNASFVNAGLYDGGLGFKYYLAPGLALRPALKFGYITTTDKDESIDTIANRQRTYKDDVQETMTFGLELALEKTLWTNGAVNVNAGLVGSFGMTNYDRESGYTESEVVAGAGTADQTSWTSLYSTEFGGGLLLGAEWFITEAISLGAEYQLGVSLSSESVDQSATSLTTTVGGVTNNIYVLNQNPLASTMDIGFQTIGLTLGIRF